MKRCLSLLTALTVLLFSLSACIADSGAASDSTSTSAFAETDTSYNGTDSTNNSTKNDSSAESGSLAAESAAAAKGTLTVTFLDVGQADSALLQCGGKNMLIDGGNVADSSLVVSALKKRGVSHLDYVVCTHAHEDHVGGLSGALSVFSFGTVYAPKSGADTKAYSNFVKKVTEKGGKITHSTVGNKFSLGTATVTVCGPLSEDADDLNNTSIVLYVVFGKTSFLFTGDADLEEETSMLDKELIKKCDVLKVGHHGSATSTGYRLLREASPEYAVISVGKDNSYGHPSEKALSRLKDAQVTVYRTDIYGDITVVSDGKSIKFSTAKSTTGAVAVTTAKSSGGLSYDETESSVSNNVFIGNIHSKKLHVPKCKYFPDEENCVYFATRAEAEKQGYTPCAYCMK